jgi:23S rRNA pseudouridine1911/1915/1917 synthase
MLSILYEDNYLLGLNKPGGLQVESDRWGNPSLQEEVSEYLRRTYSWKKQLIAGVVHRLDRPVSGAIIFGLTPMAVKVLGSHFETGKVQKFYLAIVENKLAEKEGEMVNRLMKDAAGKRSVVVEKEEKNAQEARLRYRVLEEKGGLSLLEIELLTGRYHQIRVQMSAAGCPVLEDEKYGSAYPSTGNSIYLHSHRIKIPHPTSEEVLEIVATPPDRGAWRQFKV